MLYTVYKLYIDWIKNKHCLYNQHVFLPFQMKIDVHFVMFVFQFQVLVHMQITLQLVAPMVAAKDYGHFGWI